MALGQPRPVSSRIRLLSNFIATLKATLARAMFWRRRATAPDTADELAETVVDEERPAVANTDGEAPAAEVEAKPGLFARLAALLRFARRKPAPDVEPVEGTPPPIDTPPTGDEEAPRPPLAKRVLAILIRKSVWMPATALLLIAVSVTASVMFMRGQQEDHARSLKNLHEAKLKLEEENEKLRTQQTNIPPAAKNLPSPTTPAPTEQAIKPDPAFDIADNQRSGAEPASGDCVVSDKNNAGASLKACIDSFNQASGSSRRK